MAYNNLNIINHNDFRKKIQNLTILTNLQYFLFQVQLRIYTRKFFLENN